MGEIKLFLVVALIVFMIHYPASIPVVILIAVTYFNIKAKAKAQPSNRTSAFVNNRDNQLQAPEERTFEHASGTAGYERGSTLAGAASREPSELQSIMNVATAPQASQASLDLQSQRDALVRAEDAKKIEAERVNLLELTNNAAQSAGGWGRVEERIRKRSPKNASLISAIVLAEVLPRKNRR